jgi:hypothetical protein
MWRKRLLRSRISQRHCSSLDGYDELPIEQRKRVSEAVLHYQALDIGHFLLAAQFWVETGGFANNDRLEWDARTAYAACLTQDATSVMEKALSSSEGVEAFVEILSNAPVFDHKKMADLLVKYYSQRGGQYFYEVNGPLNVTADLEEDFIRLASTRFLDCLVERCSATRSKMTDTIAGYCMMELSRRRRKLSFATYAKALALYKSEDFTFNLMKLGHLRLSSINPGSTQGTQPEKS